VNREAYLLQIVLALSSTSRFPRLLDSRQQEGNQNRDNRDDNQKLNQRKTSSVTLLIRGSREAPKVGMLGHA
jgi:hypothetical protein